MNKPHKHAEVIKAWADGAEIESRDPEAGDSWFLNSSPSWRGDMEYRVKPQPKKYKVDLWLAFNSKGVVVFMYDTRPPLASYDDFHVVHHTLEGELPNV